ncbi:MAG: hypothetical protein F6K36_22735 [Symploca sp. SIO3C6]|nr:hypothetical protein [Symploca sp. SIO3C6]
MTHKHGFYNQYSGKKADKKLKKNNNCYHDSILEIEEEKIKFKRALSTSISKSLNSERETLKNTLQEKYNCLLAWNAHYDYDLWNMVEKHFNFLWLELEPEMYLGVEYCLYEEVRNLFLELRNFFQWTGRIKERIYFAAWLKREAERRQDTGIIYLGISSLVWSYTSSGCYQDLEKAYKLWDKLAFDVFPIDSPIRCDKLCKNIKDSFGSCLYAELLIEVHESGVRLAVRKSEFDKAFVRIEKGKNTIDELFKQELITRRLKERFTLAFNYHKGIVFHLMQEYREAEKLFRSISERAEYIGWNRVIKGAKSWLATLAMVNQDYSKCKNILEDISSKNSRPLFDKRDGFCYLIKSQVLSKEGRKEQAEESQKNAIRIFKKCSKNNWECTLNSFILLSSEK